jgi:hypothetical protein
MRNLYAKLGAHTRAEAVGSARALSLLAPVRIGAVGLAAQETPVRGTLTRSRLTIDPPSKTGGTVHILLALPSLGDTLSID